MLGRTSVPARRAPSDTTEDIEVGRYPVERIEPRQHGGKTVFGFERAATGIDLTRDKRRARQYRIGHGRNEARTSLLDQQTGACGQFERGGGNEGRIGEERIALIVALVFEHGTVGDCGGGTAGSELGNLCRGHTAVGGDAGDTRNNRSQSQRRGEALQESALLGREWHALEIVLGEEIPAEGCAPSRIDIGEAAFMADLMPLCDLRKFQERCRAAIGVEHLMAVEFAIAVDGGEGQAVTDEVFRRQIRIVDFTVEAELAVTQGGFRIGGPAQEGPTERICGPVGSGKSIRDKRRAAVPLPVECADEVDRQTVVRREAERTARAELVLRVKILLL